MEFDAQVVERIRRVPGNEACADCGAIQPEWASINLGVVICMQCSGAHRSLGTHVSQVRGLKLDNWTEEAVKKMESLGNEKVNAHSERFVPFYYPRPAEYPKSDSLRHWYVKMKYERKAFEILKDEEEEKQAVNHKEGFLVKQSKNDVNKWQKRWIVLSEGAVAYYRAQDSQTPKGVIRIGSTAIFGLPSNNEITMSAGLGHREYHFRSTVAEEIIEWLVALRASMSSDGRGSLVRRALGSTLEAADNMDDNNDEQPPGSEELIREASRLLSEGHGMKQGWLTKRSSVRMVNLWSKRYFILTSEGVLYYFRNQYSNKGKWKAPMGAMSVVGACIQADDLRPFAIAVRCPEVQMMLSAENEEDRASWIATLKAVAEAHNSPAN